jgi:hypothetical protein
MAFTHDHINAFAIVSGDSDFIALVNKLKQYNKLIFVVGGRAFTSTILQKNCHEFISYESLLDEPQRAPRAQHQPHQSHSAPQQQSSQGHRGPNRRPAPLDLALSMPLVERALQVLERREVRPQLGLLKSTMLQLDSTFNEKAYGSGSFSDFVEKLKRNGMVNVTGGEGRYMISRKDSAEPEKAAAKPEAAIPILRDVLESHRLEMEDGCNEETLAEWVRAEQPTFDWKGYGFQEFSEFLNYAQDKLLVRVSPQEEQGLLVRLGPEFHPPAVPEPAPAPVSDELPEEDDGPQPVVAGQPTARTPKPKRSPRKKAADGEAEPRPRRTSRKKTPE